jgi:hypothetical protein
MTLYMKRILMAIIVLWTSSFINAGTAPVQEPPVQEPPVQEPPVQEPVDLGVIVRRRWSHSPISPK